MNKIWIILVLLFCVIGCGKDEKQIYSIGETVCIKDNPTLQGPIIRVTKSTKMTEKGLTDTYCVYHVKILYKNRKGYIVFRQKTNEVFQIIPDPR